MSPWGYKAYVPIDKWMQPSPTITRFVPGHDSRLVSNSSSSTVPIELHFSQEMDCNDVLRAIEIHSTTEDGSVPSLNRTSVSCRKSKEIKAFISQYTGPVTGEIPSAWTLVSTWICSATRIRESHSNPFSQRTSKMCRTVFTQSQ